MTEFVLILLSATLIYYVATRVATQGLIFRLKKEAAPANVNRTPAPEAEKKENALLLEGQELFNKGEFEGAEKKFLAALKLDPKCKDSYHFLGMIYMRQELYKGAIATLEKACELDPLNDTDFNNLGLAYYNIGNNEEAIKRFEKSISLNDKIAHRHLNLAMAYQKLKDWDKAAISIERAVKIHPNKESLTMLFENYRSMGDKKLAQKALNDLLELDPEDKWAKRQQAAILKK